MTGSDRTWLVMTLAAHLGKFELEAARLRDRIAREENDANFDPDLLGVAAAYEREARICRRIIAWLEQATIRYVEDARFAKPEDK